MKRIALRSVPFVLCAVVCVALAGSSERLHDPARRAALDAFAEIAFTSEYGGASDWIRKWTVPMKVAVHGDPTDEDRSALKRAMDGLNAVAGFPGAAIAESGGNVDIWFIPLDEMGAHFPKYVQGNWGFFYTKSDDTGIAQATIAVAEDVTGQAARNHLIFEEFLQSAGLMQDNYDRPDSIFYGLWTTVQQPSSLDWELLGILYGKGIRHGMPRAAAMEYLEDHYDMH
jgi:hypothetical protein